MRLAFGPYEVRKIASERIHERWYLIGAELVYARVHTIAMPATVRTCREGSLNGDRKSGPLHSSEQFGCYAFFRGDLPIG